MAKKYLILLLLLCSIKLKAQTNYEVHGSVTDSLNGPLTGASVRLMTAKDTVSTAVDADGNYIFKNISATSFKVSASMIGFQTYSVSYNLTPVSSRIDLPKIQLREGSNLLKEVEVIGVNPIVVKEDTIQYNAAAYPVREGAPVEDMLKKLPGVAVDKDGNITAQGKQISRVRVNGKDFFGGDVQTATQNLPADILENVQIIDDYGDQANLTGIKSGEPEKILNITIQKGKRKGYFGNGTAGGGTDERYLARVIANNFNEEQQISFLGSINNTNANTFNFNGGGKGGGSRGSNLGSSERGNNPDGITLSKSIGANFRDQWGKKLSVYGSYSFSGRNNNTLSSMFQNDYDPSRNTLTQRNSDSHTSTGNHRLTWNMEYAIDSLNYLKITPYFASTGADNQINNNSFINRISNSTFAGRYTNSLTTNANETRTPSYGSDFTFNHKFAKRGRNINLTTGFDYSARNQDREIHGTYFNIDSSFTAPPRQYTTRQNQLVDNDANNNKANARISYVEPLSKTIFLEASYAWNRSNTESFKGVNNINPNTGVLTFNQRQSNNYEYQFTTNRYGLNLRSIKPKYNYTLGVIAQPSHLAGQDLVRNNTTSRYNFNIAPNARFIYNFARNNTFTLTYGGASNQPSFNQIQPVVDSTNLRNIVIGNPNLDAEFTNRLSLQYNKFDIKSGNSLFANLAFDQTQDKIVTNRTNDPLSTSRTITYLNTDGFYGINSNISFSKPFSNRKYTVTVAASANFDNNLSFAAGQKNHGQNWFIRPLSTFRIDLEDIIDAELKASYLINKAIISYPDKKETNQANSLNLGLSGRNYFFKDWTLGYDFTKQVNSGYASNVNANPNILNLYVERRFLKQNVGTLRLQALDLFNENTGVEREIGNGVVTDTQSNRLGRYFLLTFNLRIQKFAGRNFSKEELKDRYKQNREQMMQGGGRRNEGSGSGGSGSRSGGSGGMRRN